MRPWLLGALGILTPRAATAVDLAFDGPGVPAPDRAWDQLTLRLELTVDARRDDLQGVAHLTARRLGPGPFRFHAVGLELGAMTLDGAPVMGAHVAPDHVDVPVPDEVTEVHLVVPYTARPQTGLHRRGPPADDVVMRWSQGEDEDNRHWFPGWDHPGDRVDVTLVVTTPSDQTAVGVGDLVRREAADPGATRWIYHVPRPIPTYLVALVVGDVDVISQSAPVPLEAVVPRGTPRALVDRQLGGVGPMLAWFAETLDEPFPFGTYRQVAASRFLFGGMENPGLVVIDDAILHGWDDLSRDRVMAHEAVHMWFGDLVTARTWPNLWLNEGFAEYWETRWDEHAHGAVAWADQVRGWHAGSQGAVALSPRWWSRVPGSPYGSFYSQGASLIYLLEGVLGRDTLDALTRSWIDAHRDDVVETDDFRRHLERATGRNLSGLFDAWCHTAGLPAWSASWAPNDQGARLTLHRTDEGPDRPVPLVVEVGGAEGTTRRKATLSGRDVTLDLPGPVPVWVAVDPEAYLPVVWAAQQPDSAWIAQATRSPSAGARLDAIAHLGEADSADALAALLHLAEDGDATLRRHVFAALGAAVRPDALPTLLAALGQDVELRNRVAAADALGRYPGRRDLIGPLDAALRRDPSEDVRAAALRALVPHDPALALSRARAIAVAPSTFDAADEMTAVGLLGRLGTEADRVHLLGLLGPAVRDGQRRTAAEAVLSLTDPEDDDAVRAFTRAVLPMLDDLDVGTRRAGISLLHRGGGPEAENALRALAARSLLPGEVTAAREAAQLVTQPRGARPPPTPTPDLHGVEDRIAELQRRLEALEAR